MVFTNFGEPGHSGLSVGLSLKKVVTINQLEKLALSCRLTATTKVWEGILGGGGVDVSRSGAFEQIGENEARRR